MSILLIFENKNPEPWKKTLEAKLPNITIEIYPDVTDVATVDFVICWKPKKNILKQFPNIKIIQSVGASIDHITNSQIINKNEIITRIIDKKLSDDMWEFLVTIVLMQLKNNNTYMQQQKSKKWKQHDYQSINNTTICILGLGNIGGHVAQKFSQLGFKVKGWSNSRKDISKVDSFCGKDELHTSISNSNFLINLLPLTDETRDILNKNTLQKLEPNAFLINVGRGEHLIETDLIELLDSSLLSGAFLDVFRQEPLPRNHPFWKHPKIHITPHVASLTNIENTTNQIVDNYYRFLNHEKLLNTVSLKKGY
jgi:glyoxylate/hydroxypyruvate reductase A